jgi:hypothetical protein
MKTSIRSSVLIGLFILIIISVFAVFAALRNNNIPISVTLILPVILIASGLLLAYSLNLLQLIRKFNDQNQTSSDKEENIQQETFEEGTEKTIEIEFDYKKIIPKEKVKLETFSDELLRNLSNELPIVQAILYAKDPNDELFKCTGKFAYYSDYNPADFKVGETLSGQAVKNKSIVTLSNIPENYMIIASGLGKGSPGYLTYIPVLFHEEAIGLIEFATFTPISGSICKNLSLLSEKIADSLSKFIKK